jgi:small basic protein (TIGR04137 family)
MSMDASLRSASSLARHRNVLNRAERIARLETEGKWSGRAMGLPKVGNRKQVIGGKEDKAAAGAEGAAGATAAAPAAAGGKAPAAAAGKAPAAGAAKPAAGGAKPAAKK